MDKEYFDLPTSGGKCLSINICIRMQFHVRIRNQNSFYLCNKTNGFLYNIHNQKIVPSKRKQVFVDKLIRCSFKGDRSKIIGTGLSTQDTRGDIFQNVLFG